MGSIPFAFSVHHFINSVGADAGFAAIIGLAVLVLLYFAHARETATLREQSYEWAQRVQQLEARVAQLSRGQSAPPPATAPPAAPPTRATSVPAPAGTAAAPSAPASAPVSAGAGAPARGATAPGAPAPAGVVPVAAASMAAASRAVGGVPAAPAGVGAPALTAATKLIPTHSPSPAASHSPGTVAPDGPGAPSQGRPGGGRVATPEQPVDATVMATPSPATVAGGANGAGHGRATSRTAPPSRVQAPPPPRAQTRPSAAAPPRRPAAPPRGPFGDGGPSRGRRLLIGVVAAGVVAAIAVGLVLLTSGGGTSTATRSAGSASNAPATHPHRTKPAFKPSSVTVAVLNGTATNGLAHRVALKLGAAGYKQGQVTTAADQTHTATTVAYTPGRKRDAAAVAAALKLGPASVGPIDQGTQTVACSGQSPCTTTVVVTVGSDLSNFQ